MKNAPNHPARLGALAALGLTLGACQGPEASVSRSSADSPTKAALSPEQARELARLEPLLRRSQGLAVTSDANGGQKVDLQGGFQHAVIVQKNPDGTHSFTCTDSIDHATEFFARTPRVKVEEQ
jgi:hypothetical protein